MADEPPRRREIVLVNRTDSGPPSLWDYAERFAKILSLVAIPVVLAFGGWWIQDALSQRTVSKDYVELAVSILSKSEGDIDTGLRAWAVDLLNANSPVPLETEIAKKLSKGEVTLPALLRSAYQPVSTLPEGDPRRGLTQSTGRLDILYESGMTTCTAWLISQDYLMTAGHCVSGLQGALPKAMSLVLDYLSNEQTSEARRFNVFRKPIEENSSLDYAILKVEGVPRGKYEYLQLGTSPPKVGDSLFIAHHAGGQSKSFSAYPCKVIAVTESNIRHDCDTTVGVGGAALIKLPDMNVVGLHIGNAAGTYNYATRIDLIVRQSVVLRNLGATK